MHEALDEAIRAAMAQGQGRQPVLVQILFSDGTFSQTALPAGAALPATPPRPQDAGCKADLVAVLTESRDRLTLGEILDAFTERGLEWSDRTVKRYLRELQEEGRADNDQHASPPGYGLVTGDNLGCHQ